MRVLVCGGRSYSNWAFLKERLDYFHETKGPVIELIQGGAFGADSLAYNWALIRDIPITTTFHADWKTYGKSAGHKRNLEMAKTRPDFVIPFPGGSGTQDMIDIATAQNIPIWWPKCKPSY